MEEKRKDGRPKKYLQQINSIFVILQNLSKKKKNNNNNQQIAKQKINEGFLKKQN